MLKTHTNTDEAPIPPECRATVERIQSALDGDTAPDAFDTDPHVVACLACRERVQAARLLLGAVGGPEPVVASPGFASRVLDAVRADRRAGLRRRAFAAVGLAVAAAMLVGAWFIANADRGGPALPVPQPPVVVKQDPPVVPEVAPMPHEKRRPAPGTDFGAALGGTVQKPFETALAVTPKVLDLFTSPLKLRAGRPDPMAALLGPARKTLLDLPGMARAGLVPVGGAAERR